MQPFAGDGHARVRLGEGDHRSDALGFEAQRLAVESPGVVADLCDGALGGDAPDGGGHGEDGVVALEDLHDADAQVAGDADDG